MGVLGGLPCAMSSLHTLQTTQRHSVLQYMHLFACPRVRSQGYTSSLCLSIFVLDVFDIQADDLLLATILQ